MTNSPDTAYRTCPGRHSAERPAPKLLPNERLCRYCVGRTMRYLEDLTGDLVEIEATVARQSTVRNTGTARTRHDDAPVDRHGFEPATVREGRLPFNPHAAEVRSESIKRLVAWAQYVAASAGITLPSAKPATTAREVQQELLPPHGPRCLHDMVPGTCAYCAGHPNLDQLDDVSDVVNPPAPPSHNPATRPHPHPLYYALAVLRSEKAKTWLRDSEAGAECAAAVAHTRGRVRATVDRFDRRWFAGRCGLPTDIVEVEETAPGQFTPTVRHTTCTADLYAEPGKTAVVCDGYREPEGVGGCGGIHPVVARHHHIVDTIAAQDLTIAEVLAVAQPLLGRRPAPDTVKKWRRRGKLRPLVCLTKHWTWRDLDTCRVCAGEIYRAGHLIDLIRDDTPRTGPKRVADQGIAS